MTRFTERASGLRPAVAVVLIVASSVTTAPAQCPQGGACRIAAGQAPQHSARTAVSQAAVVRVVNHSSSGRRCYGSGTLVHSSGEEGIVLTCAHLFGRQDGVGKILVTFPNGGRFEARLVIVDHAWDLAALRIAPPQATPAAIAKDYPRPGDTLWSCGYGPQGRYRCNRGTALGYARVANTQTRETLELSGTARDGDSGGPVFNSRGQLVAVLWGTDGRSVGGTYCGRIRKFLAGVLKSPLARPGRPAPITPSSPAASPPAKPQDSPTAGDRLDRLRGRLDALADGMQDIGQRLDQREAGLGKRLQSVEELAKSLDPTAPDGLASALRGRIEKAEAAVGSENLRGLVREAAGEVLAERLPGAAQRMLPALLAALGWTGPPSIAAVLAIRLAAGILRRRIRKKRSARRKATTAAAAKPDRQSPPSTTPAAAAPLNDQYAEQLARVYALSGRSPTADATLGREYDEELRRAEQSSDGKMAAWAGALRGRVASTFYRIHGQSPTPAEPAGEDD